MPAQERRPLKTRGWRIFQKLAAWLARLGVSPNAISISSIAFGAAAGATLAATRWVDCHWALRLLWVASVALIQLRLIANLLDGMVAIEGGKRSDVGELFNEVPDRISDSAILIGAGYAVGGHPVAGMLAAVTAVFVAYVRAIGSGVGAGQVFLGPMAKPQRMFLITVACLYSGLAPVSWQPLDPGTRFGIMGGILIVIIVGGGLTAIRRLRAIAASMRDKHPDSVD